jgi:isopropylmalate/homocitrate/citramalate synthase
MNTTNQTTEKKYQIVNGTSYHEQTPKKLIDALEYARANKIRVILDYGDTNTKTSWNECHDIAGYIGRSTGQIKVPLLIHNTRSTGGGAILDHCILSVKTSKGKSVLYQL